MSAWLQGIIYPKESAVAAVAGSRAAGKHSSNDTDFPLEDVGCAVAIDTFDFGMKAERRDGRWIARAVMTV
jgi:hypothetical protein